MQRYVYQPLLPAANSIRLVQILPGEPGSSIYCRIIDYTIRDDQASGLFEGLSYVWGNPAVVQRIYIAPSYVTAAPLKEACSYMDVAANLSSALQRLRDRCIPRTMWIDAICINQDDLGERASQVSFMVRIYSHALRVIVWLGDAHDDDEDTFHLIEDAAEYAQSNQDISTTRQKGFQVGLTRREGNRPTMSESSFFALMSRPWFRRIWVLQEVAAARSVLVICGSHEIAGARFTRGLQTLIGGPKSSWARKLCYTTIQVIDWDSNQHRQDYTSNLGISVLGELLERFHKREATDRRDKIFALLGMASDGADGDLTPDYTKSWANMFANLIRHIFGTATTVFTWDTAECAFLTVRGCALGVMRKSWWSDGHWMMNSSLVRVTGPSRKRATAIAYWPDHSYCRDIRDGDIMFLASGATRPSIIRLSISYFDIIVAAMPEPSRFRYKYRTSRLSDPDWHENLTAVAHSASQITMVWDWTFQQNHAASICRFETDTDTCLDLCIPRHSRLLNHARFMDSINPMGYSRGSVNNIDRYVKQTYISWKKNLLETFHYSDQATPPGLLQIVWSYQTSYTWLTDLLEELRWCSWFVQQPHVERSYSGLMVAYWKERGYLCLDWISILSLLSTGIRPIAPDDHLDNFLSSCFGRVEGEPSSSEEVKDNTLYSALFPPYLHPQSAANGTATWSQGFVTRLLFKAVIAQSPTLLQSLHVSEATLLVKPLVTGSRPVRGPRSKMHLNFLTLALISEAQNNVLSLSLESLREARRGEYAELVFDFLLRLLTRDISSVYNILSTLVGSEGRSPSRTLPKPPHRLIKADHDKPGTELAKGLFIADTDSNSESADEHEFEQSGNRDQVYKNFHFKPQNQMKDEFLDNHLKLLTFYMTHTELYRYAASVHNDRVLPFLHRRYTRLAHKRGTKSSRDRLLQGFNAYEIKRTTSSISSKAMDNSSASEMYTSE
ncbi:hypothetical protein OPT61_g9673 [Boeremia exigua]|uniref:Uncharacterized protein n=1 Tax=Boeremia exigua TaxID=749465 RepID=A0ACC2HU27_9PLEO|nr:hypothetical protein OPT61_g9673 [Boeremia exigua]